MDSVGKLDVFEYAVFKCKKKTNETSVFVKRIFGTAIDGLDGWCRRHIIDIVYSMVLL